MSVVLSRIASNRWVADPLSYQLAILFLGYYLGSEIRFAKQHLKKNLYGSADCTNFLKMGPPSKRSPLPIFEWSYKQGTAKEVRIVESLYAYINRDRLTAWGGCIFERNITIPENTPTPFTRSMYFQRWHLHSLLGRKPETWLATGLCHSLAGCGQQG